MTKLTSQKYTQIKVSGIPGFRTLWLGGFPQSGGLYHWIWKTIIRQLPNFQLEHILLLGLGGGTAIKQIRKKYPHAEFTAIELDQQVVDAAQRYFLSSHDLAHTTIVNQDAQAWLAQDQTKYDLVIVDLYLGDYNPPFTRTKAFLWQLQSRLLPGGSIIYNAHHHAEDEKSYLDFLSQVRHLFSIRLLHSGFHHRYLLMN